MRDIVLLDIDGTLIDSGGAGTRALNSAFLELFGLEAAFEGISMAGKTDTEIIREGLKKGGIPGNNGEVESIIIERYTSILTGEIENTGKKVMPGVFELLETLEEAGNPLGLLTGNIERGARIKLNPFGLNRFFISGAFGSDHEDRKKLLPVALERFSEIGVEASPENCVVIGDTPRDIECSRVHGARCIAVATGPYSVASLLSAGADLVLESLMEKDRCTGFIRS